MGRILLIGFGIVLVAVVAAMVRQHAHYASIRWTAAQDRQDLFHDDAAFHVLTFVKLREGDDPVPALRMFRDVTAETSDWIYAGRSIVNVPSSQLGAVEWSAVVLAQYPTRAAYDAVAATPAYRAALDGFAAHFEEGMQRSAFQNLLLPQALLFVKLRRLATFTPSPYPFTPVDPAAIPSQGTAMLARLRGAGELGAKAAVVINLQKRGTPEQEAADARYVAPMVGLMAERGYGPIHRGQAVRLSSPHAFDQVAIVYYPGTDYFADMFSSTFYQGIWGDKQLGDNQSTITVPILDLIEAP